MKYWEIIADRLSKAGWSLGWVSAVGEITDTALVWREGLTDWQPIGSVLPQLATIRQKEYLKFLGHPTTRDMTFEEAQSQLDALVRDNPAKKLALDRWDVLAQKRDEVLGYFQRSETKCPVSDFDVVPRLEEIEASNPERHHPLA